MVFEAKFYVFISVMLALKPDQDSRYYPQTACTNNRNLWFLLTSKNLLTRQYLFKKYFKGPVKSWKLACHAGYVEDNSGIKKLLEENALSCVFDWERVQNWLTNKNVFQLNFWKCDKIVTFWADKPAEFCPAHASS